MRPLTLSLVAALAVSATVVRAQIPGIGDESVGPELCFTRNTFCQGEAFAWAIRDSTAACLQDCKDAPQCEWFNYSYKDNVCTWMTECVGLEEGDPADGYVTGSKSCNPAVAACAAEGACRGHVLREVNFDDLDSCIASCTGDCLFYSYDATSGACLHLATCDSVDVEDDSPAPLATDGGARNIEALGSVTSGLADACAADLDQRQSALVGDCDLNMQCGDRSIEFVPGGTTVLEDISLDECKGLCTGRGSCNFYTYEIDDDQNAIDERKVPTETKGDCTLWKACSLETTTNSDLFSGHKGCDGKPVGEAFPKVCNEQNDCEGTVLDQLIDIANENDCRRECDLYQGSCGASTYYTDEDFCVLWNSNGCTMKTAACAQCSTSQRNCAYEVGDFAEGAFGPTTPPPAPTEEGDGAGSLAVSAAALLAAVAVALGAL